MKKINVLVIMVFMLAGCRQAYIPPVESLQNQLLVVEANLDPVGPTTVSLSRTTKLTDTARIRAENNAVVTVEGKDNSIRSLTFSNNGNYFSSNLNLIMNNEYRLRIKTSSGKEYLSDYVKAISNPPLDSISWERTNEGVQIYVNTNDPSRAAKYFRWDYIETWETRSFYNSILIYQNGSLRQRIFPAENITNCWKHSPSTRILLANSARLQSGIISRVPVAFIPVGDEKLFIRYSIIAKQYALEKDAYNYFEILKKNTEEIGSFFGPQPAEIKGNLHCLTQPDEPVIGFVTASGVTEKRIFISSVEIGLWPHFFNCIEKWVPNHPDSIKAAVENGYVPGYHTGTPPDLYLFGTLECIDCVYLGGSNRRPLFW